MTTAPTTPAGPDSFPSNPLLHAVIARGREHWNAGADGHDQLDEDASVDWVLRFDQVEEEDEEILEEAFRHVCHYLDACYEEGKAQAATRERPGHETSFTFGVMTERAQAAERGALDRIAELDKPLPASTTMFFARRRQRQAA